MSGEHASRKEFNPGRMQMGMLVVGVLLLAFALIPGFVSGGLTLRNSLQSYLWGWEFWGGLTFGCFAMTLLHHCLKGAWGTSVMRIWEAGGGAVSLFVFFLLFLPVLWAMFSGTSILYAWADPNVLSRDPIWQHRHALTSPLGALLMTVIVIGFWWWLADKLRRSTLRQDENLDALEEKRRFTWGPVGLVFFVLSGTVAFTVWFMSLDKTWSSTMYAPVFIVGHAFAALCLGVFIVCFFASSEPYRQIVSPKLTLDLGNMMLCLTMFFTYLAFSQYLIIWNGNLPETASYYHTRATGGWIWIGLTMVAAQFFIPFLMLINPTTKRYPNKLMVVAAWIFVVRIIDSYWIVLPAFPNRVTPMPAFTDALAFIGLGAIWFAVFASQIKKAPLLPVYDQRLKEAVHSHA
jgi:hypothetical protein